MDGATNRVCVNETTRGFWLAVEGLYLWDDDAGAVLASATELLPDRDLPHRSCLRDGSGRCLPMPARRPGR